MYQFELQVGNSTDYLIDKTVSLDSLVNTLITYNLEFVAKDYVAYFVEHSMSLYFKTARQYDTINHMGALNVYIKYMGVK